MFKDSMNKSSFKMTNKQKRIIDTLIWFSPSEKWTDIKRVIQNTPEWNFLIEDKLGATPEEVYFSKTDKGIVFKTTCDLERFLKLWWGHRRMALHITMWNEGWREGVCFPQDFILEPEYIRNVVLKDVFGLPEDWYLKYILRKLEEYI